MSGGLIAERPARGTLAWLHRVFRTATGALVYVLQLDPATARNAALSIGICRVALFSSLLWVHFILEAALGAGDIGAYIRSLDSAPFYYFSLLKLFRGSGLPSPEAWQVILVAAKISTLLAVVGLFTRPAMVVAVVANLMLALLDAGRLAYWSHPYNVVFLVGLAFMFGRADASLSLDRVLASAFRWYPFGRVPADRRFLLAWPVFLGQLAVALFYFAAFYSKMYASGLAYIFSDNLRVALALTWTAPKEFVIPWYIEAIWSHQWLWIAMMLGHVLTQALPLLAAAVPHRPYARLLEGLVFVAGVIGLRVFMTVWNPWWILLAVFFVDWDHWLSRFHGRAAVPPIGSPTTARLTRPATLPFAFSAVFLGYYGFVFLTQRGYQELNYPFCSMDMYSGIYAQRPYDQHLPYPFTYGDVTLATAACPAETGLRWTNITGFGEGELLKHFTQISRKATITEPILYRCQGGRTTVANLPDNYLVHGMVPRPLDDYRKALEALRFFLAPLPSGAELELWGRVMMSAAYPASPRPYDVHRALRGILRVDGTFAAAAASLERDSVRRKYLLTPEQRGLDGAAVSFLYRENVRGLTEAAPLRPLPGMWVDGRFEVDFDVVPKPFSVVVSTTDPATGRELQFYGPDEIH
jgi:hypothetical protein